MKTHNHDQIKLTKNQQCVFSKLDNAKAPLSAYTLLDELRDEGFRAPLQVYRALEKLIEFGIVHRVETLNAFVACNETNCTNSKTIAFTICETCGDVTELVDSALTSCLKKLAKAQGFQAKQSTIELRGLCKACA